MIGSNDYPVPWNPLLTNAVKKNYDSSKNEPVYLQIASVRSNGTPKIQQIVFQDFLEPDPRVLIFSAATRNAELMGVIKSSQTHEIFWQMPKTRETFTLTGRIYIVATPSLSHRFGSPPRRITLANPDSNSDEFWESERLRQWRRLAPTYRASFTWPQPGEPKASSRPRGESWSVYRDQTSIRVPPPTIDTGFKYTRLDAMEERAVGNGPTSPGGLVGTLGRMAIGAVGGSAAGADKGDELRCVHNSAFDNYCLLIFKATRVDHWKPGAITPPERTIYVSSKDGAWTDEEVNP
ncbi:hypothetical protein HK097_007309 [Rhizophlyctis rosea]|uniref:Pyridoxamine 5'-phosphate oxidase Alr4036 family FMN-binding domain-containing protein n=1 Tax=Rhizophlyctis rosea TaxID=64517 RepID=A0AAD5X4L4_9FUNG|nr:hypothetical protein HK097_007309 [Rhizophlyctis rosea]